MSEEIKNTHYHLSTAAVAKLSEILPSPQWYKDEPKQGMLIGRAFAASEALPDTKPAPVMAAGEKRSDFNERHDAWGDTPLEFDWSDKLKSAVKTCVSFYLKQGHFHASEHTVALLTLLDLGAKASSDEPKKTHYELGTGAVALLSEILPTPMWYKEEAAQGEVIDHAFAAHQALPATAKAPEPEVGEEKELFEARADLWADANLEFEMTAKQVAAVKACTAFYLKQGAFRITKHTVALLTLLGLDDE